MRARLGGRGALCGDVLNYAINSHYGFPGPWVGDFEFRWHAEHFRKHHPEVQRFDAADPPLYESTPMLLRRLELLEPGEARRIPAAEFKTEARLVRWWRCAGETLRLRRAPA